MRHSSELHRIKPSSRIAAQLTMEVRMNAELPAFDPNQVDAAFAAALEEDGLPPLYPNQPRWAFEDGRGGAEAEAFAQRRSDAAFAHVKLLARRNRGKKQPPGDWRALCATRDSIFASMSWSRCVGLSRRSARPQARYFSRSATAARSCERATCSLSCCAYRTPRCAVCARERRRLRAPASAAATLLSTRCVTGSCTNAQ